MRKKKDKIDEAWDQIMREARKDFNRSFDQPQPDLILVSPKQKKWLEENYWLLMQPRYIYYPVKIWRNLIKFLTP